MQDILEHEMMLIYGVLLQLDVQWSIITIVVKEEHI